MHFKNLSGEPNFLFQESQIATYFVGLVQEMYPITFKIVEFEHKKN